VEVGGRVALALLVSGSCSSYPVGCYLHLFTKHMGGHDDPAAGLVDPGAPGLRCLDHNLCQQQLRHLAGKLLPPPDSLPCPHRHCCHPCPGARRRAACARSIIILRPPLPAPTHPPRLLLCRLRMCASASPPPRALPPGTWCRCLGPPLTGWRWHGAWGWREVRSPLPRTPLASWERQSGAGGEGMASYATTNQPPPCVGVALPLASTLAHSGTSINSRQARGIKGCVQCMHLQGWRARQRTWQASCSAGWAGGAPSSSKQTWCDIRPGTAAARGGGGGRERVSCCTVRAEGIAAVGRQEFET